MRWLHPLCHDQAMRETVLIVDDHDAFRDSARALLESEGFEVVGTCANGASVVAAVERLRPEIVLLDVQLPDLDGFAVAELLTRVTRPPSVVLVSSREASAYGLRLESAAACGFLPKGEVTGAALRALIA
jgi:DNA-binding NarL/FixJ family response regulator